LTFVNAINIGRRPYPFMPLSITPYVAELPFVCLFVYPWLRIVCVGDERIFVTFGVENMLKWDSERQFRPVMTDWTWGLNDPLYCTK
jgi:hypothetical protein